MGNRDVIERLAHWFAQAGFDTNIMPIEGAPNKANLIATLGSGDQGLVLSGHSDTVPFDEHRWQHNPLQLIEKNNRYYGLGATDMKGFFPVILAAVEGLTAQQLRQPIIVVATADEESSMSGARALTETGLAGGRFAVVGEPTDLRPIHRHKGIMMEAIRVVGQAGHSSNPALGNNALEVMHDVMAELLSYRQELQQRFHNPGFAVSLPTMNLGCIHGGDSPNRICGECELHLDFRLLPGMCTDTIRADIRRRLTPIAERSGTDVVLSSLFGGVEPFDQDYQHPFVLACEELTGYTAGSVGYATEAPFLKSMGLETLVMGPGSIDQAHQPDEYIATEQIIPAINILKSLIKQYCLK